MTEAKQLQFAYNGTDRRGNKVKGVISAPSAAAAKVLLRKQGMKTASVKPKGKEINLSFGNKVGSEDITIFVRQMATMMKAGVPLVQAFDIVADGLKKPEMQKMVRQIRDDVSAGGTFGSALRAHPKHFDDLFCSLVEAGEQSGALETMLDRIALYKEKNESVKKKVKSAMTYPITVLVVAAVVTAILLIKVVPTFEELFSSFGADLPAPTKMAIAASEWMQSSWLFILIGIGACGFAFSQGMQRSESFKHSVQRLSLKLPVFGKIFDVSAIARYCRTMSTTFAAGVPLVDALESAASATGNIVHESAIMQIKEDVSSGTELNVAMRHQPVFPVIAVQMVAIGEQSGALDTMLEKAAIMFEEEVDSLVGSLTAMLEPMIMSFLGVVVGGLVISMYLPIFQIGQVV
ncbi:type II secretion system F family protein [Salinibius halmophilus]|uniref:type II secretion system F family protein n=1 Tax=Salinibius halmophilus TaxID=1853216 RepID=UPI000E6638D4|nr:type II secretion system F family protein [Salinibius halmophilus]